MPESGRGVLFLFVRLPGLQFRQNIPAGPFYARLNGVLAFGNKETEGLGDGLEQGVRLDFHVVARDGAQLFRLYFHCNFLAGLERVAVAVDDTFVLPDNVEFLGAEHGDMALISCI